MTFDYLQRVVVEGQLDVENIGDVVIQANNDLGETFYLIIRTTLGETEVLEYGPCVSDFQHLRDGYAAKYNTFQFSQTRIERIIDTFLNNTKRMISQAQIVTLEEIHDQLINPVDTLF